MIPFPNCCKECKPPKRAVGCHGHCKEYLDSKEEHEKRLDQDRRIRKGQADAYAVLQDSREKSMKKRNTKGKWKGGDF